MTVTQEDALYNFLENITEPFTLEDITGFIRMLDVSGGGSLEREIAALLDQRNIAFRLDNRQWLSRRGCFEKVPFTIRPSRVELLNGILIPGHRCVPFANPVIMPNEYRFFWNGAEIPVTTTEGPPDDFYPYYNIYGEEYALQYVARDNPENESAFLGDPYEEPAEVSIHTLDMRAIYRESSFVPGDRFAVRTLDWKEGCFELEKAGKDEWSQSELFNWFEAAEGGFEDSFALLGPGICTEEQIAYAFWYGGKRMRELPAYSLEELLYEKTERIEVVPYGIESRFWFAGKDIPDCKGLNGMAAPPDRTMIEEILYKKNIPVSEYVLLSYVRDGLYRNEGDIDQIMDRVVPKVVHLDETEWDMVADFIADTMGELKKSYTHFQDRRMGMTRQRVGELHTAVIELSTRLQKGETDISWLPQHTFIVLSQIQGHSAGLLEELDSDTPPPDVELEAMDNSLDSMIDTYSDVKELIDSAMDSFRRSHLQIVRAGAEPVPQTEWHSIQISVSGTDVWRRIVIPGSCTLKRFHRLIQASFDWKDGYRHRFLCEAAASNDRKILDDNDRIQDIRTQGISEFYYEYGINWAIRIMILSPCEPGTDDAMRCDAGEGAAPPEMVNGPLRFRKILGTLANGSDMEKQAALHELGPDFVPGLFDVEKCSRNLNSVYKEYKEFV